MKITKFISKHKKGIIIGGVIGLALGSTPASTVLVYLLGIPTNLIDFGDNSGIIYVTLISVLIGILTSLIFGRRR